MPELPEVETMVRGVQMIVGQAIGKVSQPVCRYRPISMRPSFKAIQRKLQGAVCTGVRRLGKRVVISTSEHYLVLQPKMTGLVTLDCVPDIEHVRLEIDFVSADGHVLKFWDRRGLGTVELLSTGQLHSRLIDGRLGPDALEITLEEWNLRLSQTRRPIKVALLDQKMVAGIGNLYASEMLHHARIHPAIPANQLSMRRKNRLYRAMREILLKAIALEGSTLADGTYRNALNNPGSYQNHHTVYDRAEALCPTCGKSNVKRIVQSQRSTFFCPRCQRASTAS